MRRFVMLALLLYVAGATWSLTTRFMAWGDDVAALVGTVARSMTFEAAHVDADPRDGIEFVECMCAPTYSELGVQIAGLALFLGSTPLALATSRLRRRWLAGDDAPSSGGAQIGFLLQLVTLPLTLLITSVMGIAVGLDGVSPSTAGMLAIGVMNIVCSVPALADWRRLQAMGFGAPRPLLRPAAQPRSFFPAAGQ